ncbi:MAG: beta-ketoacyl-ACP synthase III [Candidatus Fimisoma sp.]
MAGIKIIGMGSAQGDRAVTNDELSHKVDTADSWIRSKTGIRSRYFAENKSNSDMAYEAAEKAVKKAGIKKDKIDFCIVCTFTPDDRTPGVACSVAGRLGLREDVMAFDLNGACSGFIYGCRMAFGLLSVIQTKDKNYGLVIGSEKISPRLDMKDRSTCVLFGDGAGAAVIAFDEEGEFGFYGGCIPDREVLHCSSDGFIEMGGQEVYRFAVSKVPEAIENLLSSEGLKEGDIDFFVCHQANERIIDNAARRISKNGDKFYKNLYTYGNTSAASIPLALCQMQEEGILREGMRVVCTGFGAGLTYGSMLIKI